MTPAIYKVQITVRTSEEMALSGPITAFQQAAGLVAPMGTKNISFHIYIQRIYAPG